MVALAPILWHMKLSWPFDVRQRYWLFARPVEKLTFGLEIVIISGLNSMMMIWYKYVFKCWNKLVFQTMVRFHLAGKPVSCSDFLADELRLFSAGTEGSTIEIERMKKFAKVRWFIFYSAFSAIFASLVVNVFYRLCTLLVCHRSGNGQATIKFFYSAEQLEEDCLITTFSEN